MEIVKFGGSSLATATTIRQCAAIVKSSPKHQVIVVSAPGKYGSYHTKVTDDLIQVARGEIKVLDKVIRRFRDLAKQLLPAKKYICFKIELQQTRSAILQRLDDANFIISRGEYLSAKLFAAYLDFTFIDAYDLLEINPDATINLTVTAQQLRVHKIKKHLPCVIGGFYGQREGQVALFSRGGSDYTGAILAVLLKASLYKNYTDTNGIQTADPRLVAGTKTIECLDFDSLDILTHNGAGVIHENVAELLKAYRIPLRVDNTFHPDELYTEVHSLKCRHCQKPFFCITHKDQKILVVFKKPNHPIVVQWLNSSPTTIVADIQKLHHDLQQWL